MNKANLWSLKHDPNLPSRASARGVSFGGGGGMSDIDPFHVKGQAARGFRVLKKEREMFELVATGTITFIAVIWAQDDLQNVAMKFGFACISLWGAIETAQALFG